MPSTALLQSSSSLGSRKMLSFDDRLANAEDLEVRKRLDGRVGRKRRRLDSNLASVNDDEAEVDDSTKASDQESGEEQSETVPPVVEPLRIPEREPHSRPAHPPHVPQPSDVGSALRRNADGSVVTPVVVKRKNKRKTQVLQVPNMFDRVWSV